MDKLINIRPEIDHLYVHIPFCPQLCDYCAFYSEKGDAQKVNRFLDALIREAQIVSERLVLRPKTIFFGGGTPSALSVSQLDKLLNALSELTEGFSGVEEFTIEMNPATVSTDKAKLLRDYGVNRISMGVQAFDDDTLNMLNRVHDSNQVIKSYEILRSAGFMNVNLDLMFAVPGQTLNQWVDTLEKTLSLGPDHLSCYCLTYEEDTEFWNRLESGKYSVNEDLEVEMFIKTRDILLNHGYEQYEISNFAKMGMECRHNLSYWRGKDYLGLGPSAFGTIGFLRYQNIANTDIYCDRIEKTGMAYESTEELTAKLRQRERWMFGMRTMEGVAIGELNDFREQMAVFIEQEIVEERNGRLLLTPAGRLFADEVASIFAE